MTLLNPIEFHPGGVVVDAGDFPSAPVPLSLLDSCRKVVCCDGASRTFIDSGRLPWRIVGDGDSIPQELKEKFRSKYRQIGDQETNDQTKAVRYLARHGVARIAIVGATGKREDHTLGNISLLADYMNEGLETRIFTDHGVFIPCRDEVTVVCIPGTQVSVFNFGAYGMVSEGLKWPVRDFSNWWQGTLNEAPSGRFAIRARGDYLIFTTY